MKKITIICAVILATGLPALPLWCAEDYNIMDFLDLERASLDDMLNRKTTVSSLTKNTLRETPGMVTIISAEEIRSSGARDLVDVLRTIPEFEFGADSYGSIGLAVRGNWANEGKVLLLWDGQTYNEPLFTNVQYDRFPIDQIESVEVIRGAGSVIYGGYAELAVINIKTRSAKSLNGSEIYGVYGQSRARARSLGGYSFGKVFSGGTEISAKAFYSDAQRSDRRFTDSTGLSYNMNDNSDLSPRSVNLYAKVRDLQLRFISDKYSNIQGDWSSSIYNAAERIRFDSTFAEAKYDWRVSDSLKLEPKLQSSYYTPWEEKDDFDTFRKKVNRVTGALTAFWNLSKVDLIAGAEYYAERAELSQKVVDFYTSKDDPVNYPPLYYANRDGSLISKYHNIAFFGQGEFDIGIFKLNAGARYDNHSKTGNSLAPRLAAVKAWDRFNLKVISSRAFRAPSIENIRLNQNIKKERTTDNEIEAGYKLSDTLYISANAFRTVIKDPIIYYFDPLTTWTYANFERSGTKGYGFNAKYKNEGLSADINYTGYTAFNGKADAYAVPGHSTYMLGLPKRRVTINMSLPAGTGISVNPSAVYTSRRYAFYDGGTSPDVMNDQMVSNIHLQFKDMAAKGLTMGLGVRDVFNSGLDYAQPYNSGHAPLPAMGRELFVRTSYSF